MPSQTEAFFNRYADTLNQHEPGELAKLHMLPSVFVVDESKKILHDFSEVENMNRKFIEALQGYGVVSHSPQVNQAIRLSDKILFANVRWQFRDADDKVKLTTHCSYTLQQIDETDLKIIVEVIDDEDKVLTAKMLEE